MLEVFYATQSKYTLTFCGASRERFRLLVGGINDWIEGSLPASLLDCPV